MYKSERSIILKPTFYLNYSTNKPSFPLIPYMEPTPSSTTFSPRESDHITRSPLSSPGFQLDAATGSNY